MTTPYTHLNGSEGTLLLIFLLLNHFPFLWFLNLVICVFSCDIYDMINEKIS